MPTIPINVSTLDSRPGKRYLEMVRVSYAKHGKITIRSQREYTFQTVQGGPVGTPKECLDYVSKELPHLDGVIFFDQVDGDVFVMDRDGTEYDIQSLDEVHLQ